MINLAGLPPFLLRELQSVAAGVGGWREHGPQLLLLWGRNLPCVLQRADPSRVVSPLELQDMALFKVFADLVS